MQGDIPTDRVDVNHHFQRQILVALRQRGPAAYQQLKPDGVEGNAFNYHLRSLKKSSLIARRGDFYELTKTGYLVVDAFSLESQRLMLRPHLYTVLLVTAGEYVLTYKHTRPPLAGKLTLLSGKMHYGDTFDDSIKREVRRRQLSDEYTSAVLCPFSVRYTQRDEIVLQRSGTLWHLEYTGPLTTRQTASGQSRWIQRSQLVRLPECQPEVLEGVKRITADTRMPIDISCAI